MICTKNKDCDCGCDLAKSGFLSEPLIIQLPTTLIKASIEQGRRIIKFEASATTLDAEGDVITQDSLLKSADYFVNSGFLDIEHYCELGRNPQYSWLHIKDPDSWIVGKPVEVYDMGNYRTGIKGEIFTNSKGEYDPLTYKYDWFWQQLKNEPGSWKASVYGYPGPDTEEGGCTVGTDGPVCATRYLVKSFRWHSTALTRNPINKSLIHPVQIVSIKGNALQPVQIITAKSYAKYLLPQIDMPDFEHVEPIHRDAMVLSRSALRKSYFGHIKFDCPETNYGEEITVTTLISHFIKCERMPFSKADIHALALSELIRRN